ncbi:MAG: hypothetical protein J5752_04415 [Clostridiales bacterium]|nr:hypothetical protein [Clostridiales bacterium]
MGFINFLAAIFGAGLGFGLAFFIAATILNKNNNLGDSHGEDYLYSGGVSFTDRDDKLKTNDKQTTEYLAMHQPQKAAYPTAPYGKALVQRPKQSQ